MLHITFDIVPYGDESSRRTLGELKITNRGDGNVYYANYDIEYNASAPDGYSAWIGRIDDYDRRDGFLNLVKKALEKINL